MDSNSNLTYYQSLLNTSISNADIANISNIITTSIQDTSLTAKCPLFSDANQYIISQGPMLDGQIIIGSSGNLPFIGSLTVSGNLTETIGSGILSLDTIQNIQTTSSPTFSDLTLSSLTPSYPVLTDASKKLISALISLTSNISGILPIANGGTGISTSPTALQVLVGSSGSYILETLTGTANEVIISSTMTQIVFSLPQQIATTSSPTFNALTLTTPLSLTSGGLGFNSCNQGDIIYASNTNTLSTLPISTSTYLLSSNGTTPYWNGPLTITVGFANQVKITNVTSNGTYYLTFVSANSGDNNINTDSAHLTVTILSGNTTLFADSLTLTNALSVLYGGTGLSTFNQGDILYASASNTLSALAISSTTYVLTSNGSTPYWNGPLTMTVGYANQVKITNVTSNGTYYLTFVSANSGDNNINTDSAHLTVTILSGNTTLFADSLTLTNALSVLYGGTGLSTFNQGDILYASALNTLSALSISSTTYVLTSNGSTPYWNGPLTMTVGYANQVKITNVTSNGTYYLTFVSANSGDNNINTDSAHLTVTISSGNTTLFADNLSLTNALPVIQGGTGLSSCLKGDILYGSSANTLSTLSVGSNSYVLSSNGNIPVWIGPLTMTVGFANQISITNNTSNGTYYLTFVSANSGDNILYTNSTHLTVTILSSNTTLFVDTLNLTNSLGVIYGGTGISSCLKGDILYGSSANTLSTLSVGSNSYVLSSNGNIPVWIGPLTMTVGFANQISITNNTSNGTYYLTFVSSNSGDNILYTNSTHLTVTILSSNTTLFVDTLNLTNPLGVIYGGTGLSTTTINNILYSSANNTIGQITTANNGTLITSGGGVPSISSTLPIAVQTNITELGTISVGTWQGTLIASQYGGTGVNGSSASNGSLLIGNGSGFTIATLTGTTNQVSITNSSGSITLALPQSINNTASVTFQQLNLSSDNNTGGISQNLNVQFSKSSAVTQNQGMIEWILYNSASSNMRGSIISAGGNGCGVTYIVSQATGSTYMGIPNGQSGIVSYGNFYVATNFGGTSALALQCDSSQRTIHYQATCNQGYSYQTPSTGASITIGNTVSDLILNPSGTLATLTITMCASPVDGQKITISTTQIITALTLSSNAGQSIKNAPTTFSVGGKVQYIYINGQSTWFIN